MKSGNSIRIIVVAALSSGVAYSVFWVSAFLAWKLYPYSSTADYTQNLGILINHSFGERFGAMAIVSILGFMAAKLNRPSWRIGLATGALATVLFHLIATGTLIFLRGFESYCTYHKFWRPLLDNLCPGILFALLAVRKQYAIEKRTPTSGDTERR